MLFGDADHPHTVLQVTSGGRVIEMSWLAALDRPELSYLFICPDDELFLEQTHLRA